MVYEQELRFFRTALTRLRLPTALLRAGQPPQPPPDMGLRRSLGLEDACRRLFGELPFQLEPNALCTLTDAFLCTYLFLRLPGEPEMALVVGPYLRAPMSREQLFRSAERYAIPPAHFRRLKDFYEGVPVVLEDSGLMALVHTCAELLWGGAQGYTLTERSEELTPTPLALGPRLLSPDRALMDMEALERRYFFENRLLEAVSQGLSQKARSMLDKMRRFSFEPRVPDPLRDVKNYCIILNTLLRKTVERSGVHPLYIDSVSSAFARRIEPLTATGAVIALMEEMLDDYCRLVKNYAQLRHSPPVRKALACIHADLTADLRLSTLAALQNISPGYLCALFRREVGQTLTDYVNSLRIEQAASLLRSGALQVQTVALYCGIPDVNYFSKLFKRHTGMTPKAYRAAPGEEPRAEGKSR